MTPIEWAKENGLKYRTIKKEYKDGKWIYTIKIYHTQDRYLKFSKQIIWFYSPGPLHKHTRKYFWENFCLDAASSFEWFLHNEPIDKGGWESAYDFGKKFYDFMIWYQNAKSVLDVDTSGK